MSLSLRFLGTAASRPTAERNVASVAVTREGETFLVDCGEGTQRQMMRYGTSFGLGDIFFTHTHADHLLGVIGLTRTLQLGGRTEVLRLWGPRGSARTLRTTVALGGGSLDRLGFPVECYEVEPGTPVRREGYAIVPFAADHAGAAAVGYALVEDTRRGRFNPELARALGVNQIITPEWWTDTDDTTTMGVIMAASHYAVVGDTSIEAFTNFALSTNTNEYLQQIYAGGALDAEKSAVVIKPKGE